MKLTIEFFLPEEKEDSEMAMRGYKYKQTLDIIMGDDNDSFKSVKDIKEFIKDYLNEYEL